MTPERIQWCWYLAGAILTLLWKWQRYCYESRGRGTPYWRASREWFELETVGSQVSWGATVGGVWLLGTVIITKQGADWLAGGVFMDVPVMAPVSFFIGALAEMIVPAAAKWLVARFGGAN
jgi:hypothetical protein